jgi:hypothetical protein
VDAVPFLSPIQYNDAEQVASEMLPNRIVECCQPIHFTTVGYPTHVASVAGASRFVDVMHEKRTEITFRDLIEALTPDEMSLLRAVAEKVADMSESIYGRRMVPRSAMLRALSVVRQIDILFPERNQIVLEVGGGSGYIGALLLQMGVRYIATDITQAFYIVQNHVLNAVAPGKVIELATANSDFFDMVSVPAGHAVHVPWWKFVVRNPKPKLAVDLFTCNQALLEMHDVALRYTCRIANDLLAGRSGFRGFILEGWGNPIRMAIWQASRVLAESGFCFAYIDGRFAIMARKDSEAASMSYHLPNPQATTDEAAFHPPIFINRRAPLTHRIDAGRLAVKKAQRYTIQDYDRMLVDVLGSANLATDDEEFADYWLGEGK